MKSRSIFLALTLLTFTLVACGSDDENGDNNGGGNGGNGGPPLLGAQGVAITEVAIYQSIKRPLMQGGGPVGSNVPLVQGRDAMLRVYYATDAEYNGEPVTARLQLAGQDPNDTEHTLAGASVEEDLNSTINIDVPGDLVGETFDYRVSLLQQREGEDVAPAHYPSADATEPVAVDGPRNTLRIIMAPFRYDYDGSGRVPDLSPERLELYRQWFLSMYPVSNVELTVREAEPWSMPIGPDGSGWQEVGIRLYGFRSTDGTPDDVYYYGIFNPTETFAEYCRFGCLLGVTLLNDEPPDTGTVALRLALGVGFDEVAIHTSAHEMGHAHGLMHAPCSEGGMDPSSIDRNYPYDEGIIGVWGYDRYRQVLIGPDQATDFMGYCPTDWVSDYHYIKALNRCRHVNEPMWHPPTGSAVHYELITVDGRGRAAFQKTVESRRPLSGKPITIAVRTALGASRQMVGQYFRYDHLPGGWLFLPAGDETVVRAEFTIDGMSNVAVR